MASPSPADASASQRESESDLDPAAFLKSVRELSEKREREDAERFRKLEAEVEKSRQERAARRAERARSISPEKPAAHTPVPRLASRDRPDASLSTPPPLTPSTASPQTVKPGGFRKTAEAAMGTPQAETAPTTASEEVPEFKGFSSVKRASTASATPSSGDTTSTSTPTSDRDTSTPSATHLARSGTLSWQRRPTTKLGSSRPTSMLASETSVGTLERASDPSGPSREQIAATLSTRDPSWFKQTAERGNGSAAYRKSKDEAGSPAGLASLRRGLPGMSREPSVEPESHPSPLASDTSRTDTLSRFGSVRQSVVSSESKYSASSTTSDKPDLKSLISADEDQQRASPAFEQRLSTDGEQADLGHALSMSSSQARLASAVERPASPSKGMGGFVQSAMMKRSDSQSKRWSSQQSASLSRQNSRTGHGGLQGSHSMPKLDPSSKARGGVEERLSQKSSTSNYDLASMATTQPSNDKDGFAKPALPHHSRSKSVASNYSTNDDSTVPPSPGSPSKRWSPTKSSWIESALTRPDSPKPASKNTQPSWMADLAKANAQRASAEVTPRSGTPNPESMDVSRPASPTKTAPFGQSTLKRSDSQELTATPKPDMSSGHTRPLKVADKFAVSPASSSLAFQSIKPSKPDLANDNARPAEKQEQSSTDNQDILIESGKSTKLSSRMEKPSVSEFGSDSSSMSSKTPSQTSSRGKPEVPTKPVNDFRSVLKSRPPVDAQAKEEPEFLSKFGNLRRTQQERYVAPDLLKDNILRGKSGLAVTSGPVKAPKKDELKESLLAKKDDIKRAKEEGRELPGQVHERKTSGVPQTPPKPEALTKRELLGRSDSARTVSSVDQGKQQTPEALARHKSLKQKLAGEPAMTEPPSTSAFFAPLDKQVSAPAAMETKLVQETSKLAARFNPGLAGLLARGSPSSTPPRIASPSNALPKQQLPISQNDHPETVDAPLEDVRKDRAKGPRRRKAGNKTESESSSVTPVQNTTAKPTSGVGQGISASKPTTVLKSPAAVIPASLDKQAHAQAEDQATSSPHSPQMVASQAESQEYLPTPKSKPQPVPGSAASVMMASLNKNSPEPRSAQASTDTQTSTKSVLRSPQSVDSKAPVTPSRSPALTSKTGPLSGKPVSPPTTTDTSIPEFKGFASTKKTPRSVKPDDNKENTDDASPSVKSVTSMWGRKPSPMKSEAPPQIQLPSRHDDVAAKEAARTMPMSSGQQGLGINVEKSRGPALSPPSSAGLPPKPAKSSRIVSGQLAEGTPNKGPDSQPTTAASHLLFKTFGSVPRSSGPLAIDTQSVLASRKHDHHDETSFAAKTLRKAMYAIDADGSTKTLPPQEDYTVFDELVYVCTHIYTNTKGVKAAQVFVWAGESASEVTVDSAHTTAKQVARQNGSTPVQLVRQGQETAEFLRAMGGIFITRRGSRTTATKQYMLCGRKHLGHIVFDEVDFAPASLCHGFVFLLSYPVTLQDTKFFLWKGIACSTDEISAARLAVMDLSENIDVTEVDGGIESASFLKVFGSATDKAKVGEPSELWQQKAGLSSTKFTTRLFRIQPAAETRPGFMSGLWPRRRPSWNSLSSSAASSRSPSRAPPEEIKVEAKVLPDLSPVQMDAEGIYLLDAHSRLFVLVGPLFASLQPERLRTTLLAQTLLFASDYAMLSASVEDRPRVPPCDVYFSGVHENLRFLFRQWDEGKGLWGTGGLMAGSELGAMRNEVRVLRLEEALKEVCEA